MKGSSRVPKALCDFQEIVDPPYSWWSKNFSVTNLMFHVCKHMALCFEKSYSSVLFSELSHALSLKEQNCLFFNNPRQYTDLARLKAKLLFMHFKFAAGNVF